MKLSDAMVLGSTMNPQAFMVGKDEFGGTCALGAICEAVGIQTKRISTFLDLMDRFPGLERVVSYDQNTKSLIWIISLCMNDYLRMTREQIAAKIVENGWDCEEVLPNQQTADVSELQTVASYS